MAKLQSGDRKFLWLLALIAIFCASVLISLNLADRYTFLNGAPFFLLSLIIGIPFSVLCTIGAIRLKTIRRAFWPAIGVFVIMLMVFTALILSVALNFNHVLDTSEPQKVTVVIEDKEIDFNRRSRDDYEFVFTYEGKEYNLEVPRSVYDRYEEGELFPIELHQGAFQHPFFIADLD